MRKAKRPSEKFPVITPKQERSLMTFEAILTATTYLLEERGYRSFSTNDIAQRAGVNINSFYQYFFNRESAVRECTQRILDSDEEFFSECLKKADLIPEKKRFSWIVDQMIDFFSKQSRLKREIFFHLATIIGPEQQQRRRKRFADRLLKFIPQNGNLTSQQKSLVAYVVVQSFLGVHIALWEPDMSEHQQELVQGEVKKLILNYVGFS